VQGQDEVAKQRITEALSAAKIAGQQGDPTSPRIRHEQP